MNDKDAVITLWHVCHLVVPWNNPERDIQRKLSEHPELFLVGELQNTVIATVMGGYEGHRGWMNYLAVDPVHRGVGHGERLVNALESLLLQLGCPKLNLQVRATNTAVIDYYRRLGFIEDPAVSMGKRLIPDR